MRIAYQGELGAFSEAAARRVNADADLIACRSFEEVFTAVDAGPAGYGVLPIENSIGGSIHRNYYLLVEHELPIDKTPADKTTIAFTVPNVPGALFKALSVFALRDVDLSKLESRPIPGRPWEYLFYADLGVARDELRCARALGHLAEFAPMLRVLGSYASWKTREKQSAREVAS